MTIAARAVDFARRAIAILIDPRAEWPRIAQESGEPFSLFVPNVLVLALVPPLANFFGTAVLGVTAADGTVAREPVISALLGAIFGYVLSFPVVILLASAVYALARSFDGKRDFGNALKLAVYALTPAWLAGVFLLLPGLRFLTLLGCYSAYLVWTGVTPLMKTPREQVPAYAALIVVCGGALTALAVVVQRAVFTTPVGL